MNGGSLLIKNIGQLITCAGGLKKGRRMSDIGIMSGADILCEDGRIKYIGKGSYFGSKETAAGEIIDASGKVVMPGFVDCHTHLIFGGDRLKDWKARLAGASYQEIAQWGGGIMSTVRATRSETEESLYESSLSSIKRMIRDGTTSCEIMSGYGLNLESEIKILRIANRIKDEGILDVAITFLGAHAIPAEYSENREEYIELLTEEMMLEVVKNKLAEFCDVFCEEGYFSVEESRRILLRGREYGLLPKIHADELTYCGGSRLAAEIGAISAEHLLCISDNGIKALAENEVIAVLLPTTSFFLKGKIPPARRMIEQDTAIALGSDFNPGTSYCSSMILVIGFACYYYRMSIEEAITASTINAAYAINRGNLLGSIEVGKQADILIFDIPSYEYLVYQFGMNKPLIIIKKGKILYKE